MEAGNGARYLESFHGPERHENCGGGITMIRIDVELHDVDDVIELINIVAETLRPGGWIDGLIEARKN